MAQLPQPLPERGANAGLANWLNGLRAYVQSLKPVNSHNTLTGHKSLGVTRQGLPGKQVEGEGETTPRWL